MKLFTALKHVFVPHEGNDYKPHFFREFSVAAILFGSVFLLGASLGSSFFIHKTVLGASVAANVLVDLTNDSRIAYNAPPLVRSATLDQAATMKGVDMVTKAYFAHESPDGVTPWHWFKQVGYTFLYAGENLAVNFTDNKDVEDAWLASPLHRKNILDARFKEIGLATIEGEYKGNQTIFVVQMFGTPATPKPVVVTPLSADTPAADTDATSTPLLAQVIGEVKGETVPEYEPIVTTSELAIVKNNENVEAVPATYVAVEQYSTWYDKLVFNGAYYVGMLYKILIVVIAIALLMMIFIEIRRQHYKHIGYGLLMLVVLTIMVYINRGL